MGVRLVERWLQDHSEATYPDSDQVHPAQRAQAYMAPFFPLRTNNYYRGRDTQSLGYSYKEHSLNRGVVRQAAGRDDSENQQLISHACMNRGAEHEKHLPHRF